MAKENFESFRTFINSSSEELGKQAVEKAHQILKQKKCFGFRFVYHFYDERCPNLALNVAKISHAILPTLLTKNPAVKVPPVSTYKRKKILVELISVFKICLVDYFRLKGFAQNGMN